MKRLQAHLYFCSDTAVPLLRPGRCLHCILYPQVKKLCWGWIPALKRGGKDPASASSQGMKQKINSREEPNVAVEGLCFPTGASAPKGKSLHGFSPHSLCRLSAAGLCHWPAHPSLSSAPLLQHHLLPGRTRRRVAISVALATASGPSSAN